MNKEEKYWKEEQKEKVLNTYRKMSGDKLHERFMTATAGSIEWLAVLKVLNERGTVND